MIPATTVVTEAWFSQVLNRAKRVTIILPPGYQAGSRAYPVLFLLHGYGGNRNTWLLNTTLLSSVDFIVVCPESGRRWFINDHAGHRYEDYLVHELVTLVDKHYRTTARHGIAGFSMGGAAAVFQALRHPSVFSVAASLSGAFGAPRRDGDPYAGHRDDPALLMPTVESHERVWGASGSLTRQTYDPDTLLDRHSPSSPLGIRLEVGTNDYARVIQMNRDMRMAMLRRGIPHEYHERPGGHDWDFVGSALPSALQFLRRHLEAPSS
jgi:putative tributyrin esterase